MKEIVFILLIFITKVIVANEQQPLLLSPELSIESGDLIFREGVEMVSEAVLAVDHGGYSHVGTLYKKENKWYVIHAAPSEHEGTPDSVVIDNLDFYLDKKRARRYAVYKVASANVEQHQKVIGYLKKQLGKPFDIRGEKGTYCTLLILDAWSSIGIDLKVQYTIIDIPLVRGKYLLPKDLRESKKLEKIYESKIH